MFLLGLAHIYGQIMVFYPKLSGLLTTDQVLSIEKFLHGTFCRVLAVCCRDVVSNEDIWRQLSTYSCSTLLFILCVWVTELSQTFP